MFWAGKLLLYLFDVLQSLRRKPHLKWLRKNKRMKGRSIYKRPDIVNVGTEICHWEVDTVVGHRKGHEAVVFAAIEKVTRNYIVIRIPGRTKEGVKEAISQLREQYGYKHFSTVFKTMNADKEPEYPALSKLESLGTKVYFAHPYGSWERTQNERHNGLLREFISKGTSIEQYTDDDILDMADTLNQRPRRIWGYYNPAELFEAFLDEACAIDDIS